MLRKYRIIILIGGIALIVLVGAAVSMFVDSFGTQAGDETTSFAPLAPGITQETDTDAAPFAAPPEGKIIIINTPSGGVRVRNFYVEHVYSDEGSMIFVENEAHTLGYDAVIDAFFVAVRTKPFPAGRQKAEQALMTWLGISQADACKLTLRLWDYERYEGPGSPFEPFAWSFCEGI